MRHILILMLTAMILSCGSPPAALTELEPPEMAAVEDNTHPDFTDEDSPVTALPEEPPEPEVFEDLFEPVMDMAEADRIELPPAEALFLAVLPEPAVPTLAPPAVELPATAPAEPPAAEPALEALAQAAPETPPEPLAEPPVPPAAPAPPSADPPVPVPVPAVPPPPLAEPNPEPPAAPSAPPSVVPPPPSPEPAELPAPAEEEALSAITREPVPMPVRPIPEPPAAIPPLTREDEGIVFSRIVRATVGQLVEIPFRGTGWIYLGELGSRRGISYDSRRLDSEGQSFVFQAEAAGTYALKFYKQDFVRDYILNDHVQVIIGEAPAISATGYFNPPLDRGRVVAEPRWPTASEEAEAFRRSGGSPAASSVPAAVAAAPQSAIPPISAAEGQAAQTNQQTLSPAPPVQDTALSQKLEPDQYLTQAREEFDAGRVAAALSMLDQFREQYLSGSDEAYWLYGQFYEANSPSRDIRLSLDYYRRLVRDYPQSSRFNDARRRIAYLERYYINIR
ncbi:hypothetical protein AGMMS50255_7380 [Spirochaetia bacterium]|nr:hypothetical protein AGMMS50255_7380 [Spirochaetia bacterium]